MFETMTSFLLLEQQNARVLDPDAPTGYARTATPDRRPYRTADGYLGVLVYTDKQWLAFFELIGRPELASDARFATITDRTRNIDELYALLAREMPARTTADWVSALEPLGIPAQPVLTPEDLFEDPHLAAVGMFEQVEHPSEGDADVAPAADCRSTAGTRPPVRGAPRLGEHGDEVLREAGVSDKEIARLRTEGVLAGPPPG